MLSDALKRLGQELIERTRQAPVEIEVEPIVDALLAPGTAEEINEYIWDALETIARFERFHGASPMTDTSAAAIEILDTGSDRVILMSPGDPLVGFPMVAFASAPTGDWEAISQLVADIYRWSRANGTLPAAGSISDRIHLDTRVDSAPLQAAIADGIHSGDLDRTEVTEIVERAIGRSIGKTQSDNELAAAYTAAVVLPPR